MSDKKVKYTIKEQAIMDLMHACDSLSDLANLVPDNDPSHSLLKMVDNRVHKAFSGIIKAFGKDAGDAKV